MIMPLLRKAYSWPLLSPIKTTTPILIVEDTDVIEIPPPPQSDEKCVKKLSLEFATSGRFSLYH